jgi:ATP-dependent DNA ligase
VSYLHTAFIDKNGIFRSSSKIGTGFTASRRAEFFRYLNENKLYEKKGEIFVKPERIIEIKYFRYRITPTPSYKLEDEYKYVGDKNSITFSHPSFERIRQDKRPNRFDTRLQQIPEFEE